MMKKLVVICILLVSMFVSANAEEILFRGIPWDSSMSDVKRALNVDYFFTRDDVIIRRWENIEETVDYKHMSDYPSGWIGLYYGFGETGLKVAGYNVASMQVNCIYGMKDDTTVDRGIDNSRLCSAYYVFEVINYETSYDDLKAKLTSLYGEGVESEDFGSGYYASANGNGEYNYTCKTTTWIGENDTAVKLYLSFDDVDNPLLMNDQLALYYGNTTMDKEIDKLQELLYSEKLREENENRSLDMDGL